MNRRLLAAGLALLLCVGQGWSLPTEKQSGDYVDDDAGDEPVGDEARGSSPKAPRGPVAPLSKRQIFRVELGGTVRMPCEFSNVDPETAIQWVRDEELLFLEDKKLIGDPENRFRRYPDNSLEISNVEEADGRMKYACSYLEESLEPNYPKIVHEIEISSAGNEDESSFIVVTPSAVNDVEQGANLTLGCEVRGQNLIDKTKSISFAREGHRLKLDEETRHRIALKVSNATRHVAGDYQCSVEIGAARPLIKHLKLRVRHVPEIEHEKEQLGAQVRAKDHYFTGVGSSVVSKISCVVHAHPPVTKMHWLKNGEPLRTDDRHLIKSDEVKSHHVLTINGTSKSDLGEYRCKAWNEMGMAVGPAIYLTDSPSQPIFKSGAAVEDSIELQWSVISYKPVVQAEIVYRKQGESSDNWIAAKDVKVLSSLGKEQVIQGRIQGIAPGLYEARARARNDEEHADDSQGLAWGPFSDPKKFDGEYKDDADAASVRGSAVKPTVSSMTLLLLLLVLSPLALYSPL